jgi:S-DNA-T family DNA segregation ATPase FtsK/SpoIIIE
VELRLAVSEREGPPADVAIRASGRTTFAALADALAEAMGLGAPPVGETWVLYSHRLRDWLAGAAVIGSDLVLNGDMIAITTAAEGSLLGRQADSQPVLKLVFTAGVQVGQQVLVAAGEHLVGRSPAARIRVDDPLAALEHAYLRVSGARAVWTEIGTASGTTIDGRRLLGSSVLHRGQRLTVGGSTLMVEEIGPGGDSPVAGDGFLRFNVPPRVVERRELVTRTLPAPPSAPPRPRVPLAAAVLPLLLGMAIYAFSRSPLTLVFVAMSPLLALGSYVEGRVLGRGDFRRARVEWEDNLRHLVAEKRGANIAEALRRHQEARDLGALALASHRRDASLWERRPQDADFMNLRVGLADMPASHRVALSEGGDRALRAIAESSLEPLEVLPRVPLSVAFAELGTIGIAGHGPDVRAVARWLVVQAACLHSPIQLSICAAIPVEDSVEWDWLKWLPHLGSDTAQVAGPSVCAEAASAREMLDRVLALVDARASVLGPYRGTTARAPYPYVMVLIHEDLPLPRASLTRLFTEGPRVGVVTVWMGRAARDLPNECQAVLEVGEREIRLTLPASGSVTLGDSMADRATAEESRQVAMELAPLKIVSIDGVRGRLPRDVGLLDTLGLPSRPGPADIAARWRSGVDGLAAPVGMGPAGPFELDLKADGPHGLIAGTTGSGKSELLQTIVCSLAASFPPSRLNFLLVDYKGGSAFRDAAHLPHTVGLVTDLDGHLANRALVSLRAELRRRERVLSDSGARDLDELEGRVGVISPPRLAIVVDEFAALVREVPGFVDGVVDLAQRGRSLGLHLLLATQRPAGVINDNIRANTNLRVCLRMSDEVESVDVIGVPDAGRIPRSCPGRAFARTGHGDLAEFQVAYAGASRGDVGESPGAVEVVPFRLPGPAFRTTSASTGSGRGDTDLDRLVASVRAAHQAAGGTPADRPWLPPLPDVLLADETAPGQSSSGRVVLGLLDEPEKQVQRPWVFDLQSEGALLVLGGAGSGKTTLLRTLAHELASVAEPADVHLYTLDCAGGGLHGVAALPHSGAYIRADETERLERFVRWLRADIDRRRALGADPQHSGVAGAGEPVVMVLLDSYEGFMAAIQDAEFGQLLDAVPRLVADGPGSRVYFAITASRRGAVPGSLWASIGFRLVMGMADEDEYRNAGIAPSAFANAQVRPGRGFTVSGNEVQCAVLGGTGSAEEQIQVLRNAARALRARFPGFQAPSIQLLPSVVPRAQLEPTTIPWTAVIGMEDATLGPALVDLRDGGQVVVGPPVSGRSSALDLIVSSMRTATPGLRAMLMAPRKSPLVESGPWAEVAVGHSACEGLAGRLASGVRNAEPGSGDSSVLVVVDDGEELMDGSAAADLEIIARRGRDHGYRVLAAVETRAAHRAYGGWVAELRKGRRGLLLQPDPDIDGELFGVRLARRPGRVFPVGRGFLIQRGEAALVQVAAPAAT